MCEARTFLFAIMKFMGDIYQIKIACDSCGEINDAYYAPSCGDLSFTCEKCKKVNWINLEFKAKVITKKEEKIRYRKAGFG